MRSFWFVDQLTEDESADHFAYFLLPCYRLVSLDVRFVDYS